MSAPSHGCAIIPARGRPCCARMLRIVIGNPAGGCNGSAVVRVASSCSVRCHRAGSRARRRSARRADAGQAATRPTTSWTTGDRFGGTRLSNDGAVARVRADVAGRRRRAHRAQPRRRIRSSSQPRGTNPTFTPDGKFVLFTIVPPQAEDETREAAGEAAAARQRRRRPRCRPAAAADGGAVAPAATARATQLGIMTLRRRQGDDGRARRDLQAAGRVVDVARVSPRQRARRRRTRRRSRRRRAAAVAAAARRAGGGGSAAAAAGAAGRAGARRRRGSTAGGGANATGEKRKDPGTDLIVRNLATGQETTIPEVTDYAWDKDGTLARVRRVVDRRGEGRRVRAPDRATASIVTLHSGKGHYKSLAFDDDRQAARVPERPGRVRQAGLAVPPLSTGRSGDAAADRARVGDDERHAGRAWS